MRLSILAVFLIAILAATGVQAQLYKWVGPDGKVTYSDTPPPKDAKDIKQKNFGDNVTASADDMPYAVKEAMKRNPVTLYANTCGEPCDNARALLGKRGILFTDRNPEKDQTAMDALKEATGGQSVPSLLVGTRVLKGFSEAEWNDALTSSGYPRTNPGIKPKPPAAPVAAATPAPQSPPVAAPPAAPAAPVPSAPAKGK